MTGNSVGVTALARFLEATSFEELPPVAIEHAKMLVSSTIASAAAGSEFPSVEIIRTLSRERGGPAEATVWFSGGMRARAAEAGRINAMQSDAAASDDSDFRDLTHTGTTVCSTALAVADATGASGQDVVTAIVAGYETCGRMHEAIPKRAARGIHGVAVNGIGAATTAAKLLRVDAAQLESAMALAATSAMGVIASANSWAREYQAGNAVLTGIEAAVAASRGYWAEGLIVDSPGGVLDVLGNGVDQDALDLRLGEEWDIATDIGIKLRPGGYPLAAAVEAAVEIAREAEIDADSVRRVTVSGPSFTSLRGLRHPTDFIGAIHSLAYCVAAGIADRDFTWSHVDDEKILDPRMRKIEEMVEVVPYKEGAEPATFKWAATVVVETSDGRSYRKTVDAPKGSARRGVAWEDVDSKLAALMERAGRSHTSTESIRDQVRTLDAAPSTSTLTALLA